MGTLEAVIPVVNGCDKLWKAHCPLVTQRLQEATNGPHGGNNHTRLTSEGWWAFTVVPSVKYAAARLCTIVSYDNGSLLIRGPSTK